jgi:hypothetical protein
LKTKVNNLKIMQNSTKEKTISMSLSDYYELTRGMKINFVDEANKQLELEEPVKVKQKTKE